jgi:N-acetylmuramoyl-L-alanine amidase
MRRKAFLTMVAFSLLVCGATGTWAAAAPFGSFDGFARGGNAGNGVTAVQGWALAETGVAAVDIVVDGVIVGRANRGRSRPTVTKLHPGFPDSAKPGFGYELDTTHFLNGLHSVTARVMSLTSQVVYLNSLQIQVANTNADLLPFGKIEFPNQQAEMFGNCVVTDRGPKRRIYNVVSGYALDVNASYNNPGVAYVELLVDGSILIDNQPELDDPPEPPVVFNSQYSCNYNSEAGGLTNCYGIRRLDLEQNFPGLKDAPHAGFRFALDVGDLIGATDTNGTPLYTPGSHQITIRVGDQFENVTDIASIAVTFTCRDYTIPVSNLAIGHIDTPVPGLVYGGFIQVSGWAVDFEPIAGIIVFIDGNVSAVIFPPSFFPRPDITALYPSYPSLPPPGWITPLIDTTKLSNGIHQLSVEVVDKNDVTTFIGKFPITIENPIP